MVQGIETLSLRMERHVANAQRVAEWRPTTRSTGSTTPGLPTSTWHDAQQKYAPRGAGAVLTFEDARREAGQKFVEAELHSHVANIGDVRSLVIHPASTTHSQLTADEQLTTGVTPGLVRLAVGLEGIVEGHPGRPGSRLPRRQVRRVWRGAPDMVGGLRGIRSATGSSSTCRRSGSSARRNAAGDPGGVRDVGLAAADGSSAVPSNTTHP